MCVVQCVDKYYCIQMQFRLGTYLDHVLNLELVKKYTFLNLNQLERVSKQNIRLITLKMHHCYIII